MKARELIGGAIYDPATLKVLYEAFDSAWEAVKPSVSGRPLAIEAGRLRLANIILSLATHNARDPDVLKDEAVRIYRAQSINSN